MFIHRTDGGEAWGPRALHVPGSSFTGMNKPEFLVGKEALQTQHQVLWRGKRHSSVESPACSGYRKLTSLGWDEFSADFKDKAKVPNTLRGMAKAASKIGFGVFTKCYL